jgi:glutaconate CoA-transferase subunit B
MEPDPLTKELTVVSVHHGVTREQIVENCGWAIKFADRVIETPVPTETELATLRDINARTKKAHEAA